MGFLKRVLTLFGRSEPGVIVLDGKSLKGGGCNLNGNYNILSNMLYLSDRNAEDIQVELGRKVNGVFEKSSDEFLIENGIDPKTGGPIGR